MADHVCNMDFIITYKCSPLVQLLVEMAGQSIAYRSRFRVESSSLCLFRRRVNRTSTAWRNLSSPIDILADVKASPRSNLSLALDIRINAMLFNSSKVISLDRKSFNTFAAVIFTGFGWLSAKASDPKKDTSRRIDSSSRSFSLLHLVDLIIVMACLSLNKVFPMSSSQRLLGESLLKLRFARSISSFNSPCFRSIPFPPTECRITDAKGRGSV
mmetsp:Transcript_36383/g.82955  ORF Transcript_36383/g.82955 Transcript_36383/m.82955 type:complete len:214 (-) Transcript_36383:147-788(-)